MQNLELFTCKTREQIGKLVKSGAKVNFRDGDGTTALMRHAQRGSLDLVVELLECQAIVDLQDEVEYTIIVVKFMSRLIFLKP